MTKQSVGLFDSWMTTSQPQREPVAWEDLIQNPIAEEAFRNYRDQLAQAIDPLVPW